LPQLPIKRRGLTEFTFSRFLVPHLSGFTGVSVFLDADILVLCDIYELVAQHDVLNAVSVAQHQNKFEWPSIMVFSNGCCRKLTPEYIDNEANYPYDFSWAASVGNIPPQYNHCVGYDPPMPGAKIVHFTQGIPCFPETAHSEFKDEWYAELKSSTFTVPWKDIMGQSIHEEHVLRRNRDEGKAGASIIEVPTHYSQSAR
jgi:hypothetical protein